MPPPAPARSPRTQATAIANTLAGSQAAQGNPAVADTIKQVATFNRRSEVLEKAQAELRSQLATLRTR